MSEYPKCPEHGEAYRFKEILDNGMIKIGCTYHECKWKSQEMPRHDFEHIENIGQKKNEWRG